MSSDVEKKIILIVSSDEKKQALFSDYIRKNVSQAAVYSAADGSEAWGKILRHPPHVVITDSTLSKLDTPRLIKTIIEERHLKQLAIIVSSPVPEDAMFLDELVTHRLQYLSSESEHVFTSCLSRALTFAFQRRNQEYNLRFVPAGDRLIREGDKADFVFIVKKGNLKATRLIEGREVELGTINVGEFVGEMAYINGEPRNADVYAVTPCELIEIPIGALDHVLYRRPAWSKALLTTLSNRLKQANAEKAPG